MPGSRYVTAQNPSRLRHETGLTVEHLGNKTSPGLSQQKKKQTSGCRAGVWCNPYCLHNGCFLAPRWISQWVLCDSEWKCCLLFLGIFLFVCFTYFFRAPLSFYLSTIFDISLRSHIYRHAAKIPHALPHLSWSKDTRGSLSASICVQCPLCCGHPEYKLLVSACVFTPDWHNLPATTNHWHQSSTGRSPQILKCSHG